MGDGLKKKNLQEDPRGTQKNLIKGRETLIEWRKNARLGGGWCVLCRVAPDKKEKKLPLQ